MEIYLNLPLQFPKLLSIAESGRIQKQDHNFVFKMAACLQLYYLINKDIVRRFFFLPLPVLLLLHICNLLGDGHCVNQSMSVVSAYKKRKLCPLFHSLVIFLVQHCAIFLPKYSTKQYFISNVLRGLFSYIQDKTCCKLPISYLLVTQGKSPTRVLFDPQHPSFLGTGKM